ncbi:MAG: glycosyltransferase [Candidatus Riflebacteria bacterium]|nr:glycosyltransferase [Candidatus Riflebacteria bacterium]
MNIKSALVIVPVVPHPDASGQTTRARNIMAALQMNGIRVDVLVLDSATPSREAETALLQMGMRMRFWHLPRLVKPLASFYSPFPESLKSRLYRNIDRVIETLGKHDLYWCDGLAVTSVLPYLPGAKKTIVDFRDALSRLYTQFAGKSSKIIERFSFRLAARLRNAGEAHGLRIFTNGAIISEIDRRWFARFSPDANRLAIVPLAFPLPKEPAQCHAGECTQWLFTGDLRYLPNLESAKFLNELMSDLLHKQPDWKLTVVGALPTNYKFQELANVSYTGFVESINPYLKSTHAILCPVFSGTGIKTKVLTAMGSMRPIIANSIALECIQAVDGTHLLRAENKNEFISAMRKLSADPALQINLSKNAFSLANDHFSIPAIARLLKDDLLLESAKT